MYKYRVHHSTMLLTRREMFEVWRQGKTLQQKNLSVLKFVNSQLSVEEFTDDEEYNSIKKKRKCKRTSKVFENRHHQWLDESIEFFKRDNAMKETNSKRGRPLKDFSEVSDQSKRQKNLPLLENYSLEELAFATRKSLEACGKRDAAKIVQEASSPKSKRATKIKKKLTIPITPYLLSTLQKKLLHCILMANLRKNRT
jgi:hypothetical protein